MENQEKWQSLDGRLSRLRGKVLLAAVFSLAFLAVVSWIAVNSFQDIVASVETLSSPRTETGLVNDMIADISEIQASSSQYSISKDPNSLNNYSGKTVHVRSLIDSLKNQGGSKDYAHKLDTLLIVFEEYVQALNDWVLLRSANTDLSEYKMYGLIKSGDSSLKHTSQFLPKAEIKSVTETIEKPAVIEEAKPEKTQKNRFKKNKKQNTEQATVVDSVSRQTTTQIITKVDSSYLFKVDTLLDQMKKTLTNSQRQRSGFQKKMSQRETELYNRELVLMARIRTLLQDIEQEEIALTKAGIAMSKASAEESYKKLAILAIIAICVMVFLVTTLFSDISKSLFYRKKLQEAKIEAERLAFVKEEFLANMSHEIRTPLNSIIGFTEQMQENDIQPANRAKMHAILRSSNHLLALVNDILDFSKLEAGSLKLEQIGFCYTDVVEEVIEMVEPEAKKKNILLIFEPNEASETKVTGDPVRTKQILLNLMGNAVKFTESGAVTVSIDKRNAKNLTWITCKVRDSGKGIQQKELEKIFLKFEQEDNSITRHHGGTGLGLSISKRLTELQHGKIWVESEPGFGSTFTFEIPFKSAQQNDYKTASTSVEYIPGSLARKRILVIDDDQIIEEILTPLFKEEKIVYRFIQQPLIGCEVICKESFDAIFVDLHMPEINGMDMLHKIRNEKNSLNKGTITILSTANVIKNVQISTKERIPDYVLYKPYKRVDILNTLSRAFGANKPQEIIIDNQNQPMSEEYTLKNFREFAGNDIELLDNFITLFISESEIELKKLDTHLEEKNYRQIGETAHMFKNTYGQLEAKPELLIINKLEGLVKTDAEISVEEIKHLISSLQEKSTFLFKELKEEMARLKKA